MQNSIQKSTVRIRARPLMPGCCIQSSLPINCVVSLGTKLVSFDSPWLLLSMVGRVVCSGYGQGRIKNQPSIIGMAVPTARVSKKSEVFPGKIVCASVEKRKADNPKPEMTIPVTVVLYMQERGENNQRRGSRIRTHDHVWETFRNGIQRRRVTCIAADPRE